MALLGVNTISWIRTKEISVTSMDVSELHCLSFRDLCILYIYWVFNILTNVMSCKIDINPPVLHQDTFFLFFCTVNNSQSIFHQQSSTIALILSSSRYNDSEVYTGNVFLVFYFPVTEDNGVCHVLVQNESVSTPIIAIMLNVMGDDIREITVYGIQNCHFFHQQGKTIIAG